MPQEFAGLHIPNLGVAVLAASDESTTISAGDHLVDDAVAAGLRCQRLTCSRFPTMDCTGNGSRQGFAIGREMQRSRFSVDVITLRAGGRVEHANGTACRGDRFPIRSECDAPDATTVLRECSNLGAR